MSTLTKEERSTFRSNLQNILNAQNYPFNTKVIYSTSSNEIYHIQILDPNQNNKKVDVYHFDYTIGQPQLVLNVFKNNYNL